MKSCAQHCYLIKFTHNQIKNQSCALFSGNMSNNSVYFYPICCSHGNLLFLAAHLSVNLSHLPVQWLISSPNYIDEFSFQLLNRCCRITEWTKLSYDHHGIMGKSFWSIDCAVRGMFFISNSQAFLIWWLQISLKG